jgi:uncharacterized protein YdaU (DUF1376 family)
MNYYEHHLRDYDAATLHLSWDEDMAYTRLLRWYYRKEQPVPADVKEVCRLMRATSKPQKDGIEAVLREFFELRDDGWHQDTCDAVIAEYRAGAPDREAKKKNEETRTERHRAERRSLFALINQAGEHVAWNAPIADVRKLADQIKARSSNASAEPATAPATPVTAPGTASNAPATPTVTAPATPVTATQTPDTTPHPPLPKVVEAIRPEAAASAADAALAAPMSVKDRLWTLGIALLGEKGRPKLGKLVATHGDTVVMDALQAAAREQPGDAFPWLLAACEARAKAPRLNGNRNHDARPPTTDDLLARDARPPWLDGTGFDSIFDAEGAGCGPGNANEFSGGRRIAA